MMSDDRTKFLELLDKYVKETKKPTEIGRLNIDHLYRRDLVEFFINTCDQYYMFGIQEASK